MNALKKTITTVTSAIVCAILAGCAGDERRVVHYDYSAHGSGPVAVAETPPVLPPPPLPSVPPIPPIPGAAGAPSPLSGQIGATVSSSTITDPLQLSVPPDPGVLYNRPISFSEVSVRRVLDDHLIAVGPESGGSLVYVRTVQPVVGITSGQFVNVNGVVRKVAPESLPGLGLGRDGVDELRNQAIYVDAVSVVPAR
jgi:hypothetical protein